MLHQIKADHELWVESLVLTPDDDKVQAFYANLVNLATDRLFLASWPQLSDYAILDMLPLEFVEGVREFGIAVAKAVWPGRHPVLEEALRNLESRAVHYVDLFLEQSYQDDLDRD